MADNEVKVNLTADAGPLVSELGKAERSVSNLARATREQMAQALPAIERTGTAFSDLARQYLGFHAVVSGVKAFAAMSTEMATLQARLKISTEGVGSAALAYQALFKVAQETRTPLAGMVEIFGRLAVAGREIGVSQGRMIAVTRTISQAMTVSGGSAESMRASIVQLGQGLASGTLRGEELNSVMEQTPRLAKAIADGMGVSVGRLRELGATGQLTSQQIVVALEAAAKSVEKDFAQMPLTIAGAMVQLQNSVLNGFKTIGATGGVAAEAIAAIARNLDLVIAAGVTLAATGIAAWFASGAAGAGLLAGAIAALTAPVALLAGIIAATGAGLMLLWHRFKEGRENIDLARHSLEVLQARLERQPNNRLLKTALADQRELVAGLELAAQTERERAGQMRGLAQLQAQASEAEKGRIKALADGIDVTRLLSGQSADFQVNLTKLKASYDAGGLSLKEYQTQVGALIDKQGGGKAMTEAAT
ncbi:MAG: tape measure protein, partial [Burkholderiaceae bacterium]